ncbi:hypothetical protein CHISP_0318 [Chitinispirillum alkaliphilum]|nr:hypothetical protein CHISP_0318 [Chitinispirillum alkaliphilum]
MNLVKDGIQKVKVDAQKVSFHVYRLADALKGCSCGGKSLEGLLQDMKKLDRHIVEVMEKIEDLEKKQTQMVKTP